MSNLTLQSQENALVALASAMSTALVSDDKGSLTQHGGCKLSSEKSIRKIPLSATLYPNQPFCSVPSLSLKRGEAAVTSQSTKAALEQMAASSLAEPIEASPNDVCALPSMVVQNISETFLSLVDSRFRSYIAALAEQSRTRDPNAISPILQFFVTMSTRIVSITTIANLFRIVESSTKSIQTNRLASSLVQETVIDLDIGGESVTVVVHGTGVIQGLFDESCSPGQYLTGTAIVIDTDVFLQSMAAQARYVVKLAKDKISQLYMLSLSQTSTQVTSTMIHQETKEEESEEMQNRNNSTFDNHRHESQSIFGSCANDQSAFSPNQEDPPSAQDGCNQNHPPKRILVGIDLLTKAADTLGLFTGDEVGGQPGAACTSQ